MHDPFKLVEVPSVTVRHFRKLNSDDRGYTHTLQDLSDGDQFRASDESQFVVWQAVGDPYLNNEDIWCIQAQIVAG